VPVEVLAEPTEANKLVKINQGQFQKASSLSKNLTRHMILLVFQTLTAVLSDNNFLE